MVGLKRAALFIATILSLAIHHASTASDVSIRVTLLGTGTPIPSPRRLGPSIFVEAGPEKLIFDVGRDVIVRLNQIDIPVKSKRSRPFF